MMLQPHRVHFSAANSKESLQDKLVLKNGVQELTFLSTHTFLIDLAPSPFFPFASACRVTDVYGLYIDIISKHTSKFMQHMSVT